MKGKSPAEIQSAKKSTGPKTNIFLNVLIIILAILVIFLSYSLFTKITALSSSDDETDLKTSPIIQVEVLNGCGISGIAEKLTNYLRQNDFDVVQVGNYTSFDIDNTLVVDRTGNKSNALKVAEALGIDSKNVIQQINNDYFLDISLIIGKDFNRLKPFN
ncbi:MAG TPA: LytR C-terminal domain-containing protein [Ignavibacteriaceae bacterium]|nr:LytR C-terminal domain-containing protein [Ignavibacteriaceae bacterium]